MSASARAGWRPFAIRLREDLRVTTEDGCDLTLFARLRLARRTQFFQARPGAREHAEARDAPLLNFAARRLKGERLIVVSNVPARRALAAYRKRWAMRRMFGDAKTRGLNLEDTRLTDPRKLALLMALVTLCPVMVSHWLRSNSKPSQHRSQRRPTAAWRRLKETKLNPSKTSGV